jgi:hypothetical protein
MMRLDAVSVPRIMLQVGFCGALVAGTYLIAQERPKDSARLLSEAEEAQFTLGTKGDRMIVALHQSADEAQKPAEQKTGEPKPVELAMAPETAKPAPVAAAPTPPVPPKPKRVSVSAAPATVEHREVAAPPVQTQVPASPAWASQPAPVAAQPGPPPVFSAPVAAQSGPPPVYSAPIAAQPVVPPPPPPKPKEETFLGLPPMPTPREFFDNTVKETNAAFGKMKQAMEDAFR